MAVILLMMGLSLLMQGCLSIYGQADQGCKKWTQKGDNVCCESCHPGNRLVSECGPNPKELCKPCESGTFTTDPKEYRCKKCTLCLGAQIHLESCTATTDTKCGCRDGLTCGNERCSFCVDKCGKGQEPTNDRSCRPCPDGTFNDKDHQKCKPWTKCLEPNQYPETKGSAVSDVKCGNVTVYTIVARPTKPGQTENSWPLVLSVLTSIFVISVCVTIIVIVATKILHKRKKTKKTIPKTPIIRTPTDDPRTLIAIECSFHEAQQEQGSSSESLNSKDSSEQLIA